MIIDLVIVVCFSLLVGILMNNKDAQKEAPPPEPCSLHDWSHDPVDDKMQCTKCLYKII